MSSAACFLLGLSTEAAVLDAVIYVTENMARSTVTSLVTANMSKAFDSAQHGCLWDKLGWCGIEVVWFGAWHAVAVGR